MPPMESPRNSSNRNPIPDTQFYRVRSCVTRWDALGVWSLVVLTSLSVFLFAAIAHSFQTRFWIDEELLGWVGVFAGAVVLGVSPLACAAVFGIASAGLTISPDRIVISRSVWRLAETALLSVKPNTELVAGGAGESMLEWILRPRRWEVRRVEFVRQCCLAGSN